MPFRVDARFEITGLNVVLGQMSSCQGRGFQKGAARQMKKVMQLVVVPALRAGAPRGAANRNKNVKRGRGGPENRNITVRQARLRPGEFVALSAGPRAFYAHFGIVGTKDHVIGVNRVRGAGGRYGVEAKLPGARGRSYTVSGRRSRSFNRGTAGKRDALLVAGHFYSLVRVKGVKPNDWVGRAAASKSEQALQMLAAGTLPRKDGHGLQGG